MDARVVAVLQLIRQDPRTCLRDLANAAHLSPSRLQHIFRIQQRVPIRAFAQEQLLERAAYLLTETFMSVKEIHAVLGFTNASTFCHAFKKRYAASPQAFRRIPRPHPDSSAPRVIPPPLEPSAIARPSVDPET
jgi:AraC family transcriptional regulator of arabinose operon